MESIADQKLQEKRSVNSKTAVEIMQNEAQRKITKKNLQSSVICGRTLRTLTQVKLEFQKEKEVNRKNF